MSASPPDREPETTDSTTDIAHEQAYVSMLYRKLDAERDTAAKRLHEALGETGGTPQARTERDVATSMYTERLAQLNSVEQGLCFGRLDFYDEEPTYVGRVGLFDEDADYAPLLVDWRAPVARPFYLATAAAPEGVRRRRHIRSLSRTVTGVDDEILDLTSAEASSDHDLGLAGEAALLAALERPRTGEMGDIVATIQAEQDRVIRSGLPGVLVVQGGPGTGKTAVALHRAAYLLYTHREQLTRRGVLVIGPNNTFLRYIGQVLPSLGETGVLLATIGELFPGVRTVGTDTRAAAEIKGRAVMPEVLAAAIGERQVVPDEAVEIALEQDTVWLHPDTCASARAKARESLRPHNLARRIFVDAVLDELAKQLAGQLTGAVLDGVAEIAPTKDEDPDAVVLDDTDIAEIRSELAAAATVRAALDELWPDLTPQRVLADLLTVPERLHSAASSHLTEQERADLLRERARAWTPADVPLLDELAELLGQDDTEQRGRQAQAEREQRAYAEGVLHVLEQDDEIIDEEVLRVSDVLDAELLAEREQRRSELTAAQRAVRDRTWTFGHVIVDEAQELSSMDWRLLMRRCPSRSMTLVGDVAQTSSPGGAGSWDEVLAPYVASRWRLAELTVNYRTPAEVMDLASTVLAESNPELEAPTSVRETGVLPWQVELAPGEEATRLAQLLEQELSRVDGGSIAVICPAARQETVRGWFEAWLDSADSPVSTLTVEQAKGLEFDVVLVVSPDEIVAGSSCGYNDLYVALTRATQRLGVLHTGPVSPAFSGRDSRR